MGPTARLSAAAMQFLGRLSYSLYLVHWPILVVPVLASAMGEPLPLAQSLLLAVFAVPVAWVLHRLVERPILRSPRIAARGARLLLPAGAAAIVLALVGVTAAAGAVERRPLSSTVVAGDPSPAEQSPVFSEVVPADLQPPLDEAAADLPSIYAAGCHLGVDVSQPTQCVYGEADADETIVLFGDSHAAQWFPALELIAERRGARLVSHTKSNCPPFPVEIVTNGVLDTGCAAWREAVLDSLERDAPQTIVLSGFAHYDEFGSPEATGTAWTDAVSSVVARLSSGSRVVVIDDTPRFPRTPALCLSARLENASACDYPRSLAIDADFAAAQSAAARDAGGASVDLTDRLCDDSRCGTIIGNLLVYRDQHHIATRIATLLADDLERRIFADD